MDYAYEYVFLLPNEYAKLLKFKPQVPDGAAGMCSEILACSAEHGLERKFMIESFVKSPPTTCPGTMPPPFKPGADFVHHYKKPEAPKGPTEHLFLTPAQVQIGLSSSDHSLV
ncbi:hypothetical protein Peur_040521 [Populus x canadensis]